MQPPIWRSRTFLPIVAVAIGAIAAGLSLSGTRETTEVPGKAAAVQAAAAPSSPSVAAELDGEVLEAIDVANYTYLRLNTAGGKEIWAAVPASKVRLQSRVRVRNSERMANFTSPTLHRSFATIYFGTLDTGGEDGPPAGHGMANPHAATGVQPAASSSAGVSEWHDPRSVARNVDPRITVGKVARAEGPSGVSVADLRRHGGRFAGKSVRVRGVVVRSVSGVMGRTFVHLRDGSGRADGVDDDLTVTTATTPETGQTLLVEGTVGLDHDFGSGYRYDVILENARVVSD